MLRRRARHRHPDPAGLSAIEPGPSDSSSLLGDIGTIEWSRRTRGILGRGERARFLAVDRAHHLAGSAARAAQPRGDARLRPRSLAADSARQPLRQGSRSRPARTSTRWSSSTATAPTSSGGRSGAAEKVECRRGGALRRDHVPRLRLREMGSLTDSCFTFAGAEVAAEFLESSPLSTTLRHDVLDAITLHLNPKVVAAKPLQRLTHDGIALDVLGMRSWELDPTGVERVGETLSASRVHGPRRAAAARACAPGSRLPGRRPAPRRLRPGAEDQPVACGRQGHDQPIRRVGCLRTVQSSQRSRLELQAHRTHRRGHGVRRDRRGLRKQQQHDGIHRIAEQGGIRSSRAMRSAKPATRKSKPDSKNSRRNTNSARRNSRPRPNSKKAAEEVVIPSVRKQIDEIKELGAPEGEEEKVEAFLENAEAQLEKGEEEAEPARR